MPGFSEGPASPDLIEHLSGRRPLTFERERQEIYDFRADRVAESLSALADLFVQRFGNVADVKVGMGSPIVEKCLPHPTSVPSFRTAR